MGNSAGISQGNLGSLVASGTANMTFSPVANNNPYYQGGSANFYRGSVAVSDLPLAPGDVLDEHRTHY
ncbi:MAG: hypothetical protein SGI92_26970 [Bryobacteraceae bacterium]|nr:hypothetical protein [Bryobacteraceae bacterium]